jgi:energy-coupling factor transport system ATP-binding protein
MSITVEHLFHTYAPNTPMETESLSDVNLEVKEGEFLGIIGQTGSGKSTLVQHLNGLIPAQRGQITVEGIRLSGDYPKKKVRTTVGMVFQYPEYQLFEETVEKDIAFGPKNMGLDEKARHERVLWAMDQMDLDYAEYSQRSPFELSGGEKRRVAIAGVLAMQPQYLVLDEPAAGLDPEGRRLLLNMIQKLHRETGIAVVLVSHSMDDIAMCAQRVLILNDGQIIQSGTPQEVFADAEYLNGIGLGLPVMAQLHALLYAKGILVDFDATPKGLANNIALALKRGRSDV